jgi:hypothetical protein
MPHLIILQRGWIDVERIAERSASPESRPMFGFLPHTSSGGWNKSTIESRESYSSLPRRASKLRILLIGCGALRRACIELKAPFLSPIVAVGGSCENAPRRSPGADRQQS